MRVATVAALLHAVPVLAPLIVVLLLARRGRARTAAIDMAPWLPLTLLLPMLAGGQSSASILLLGLSLGVDPVSAPLMLLCALAWTLAGLYARARVRCDRVLLWSGWLTSLAGISLALLAQEIGSFYAGYATLSLASWLLVIHARTPEAWRAGRVYLVLALAGEMAVFAGVMAIAVQAGNVALADVASVAALQPGWRALILAGFAVKLGTMPLHLWLPLAHPVAPVPASAILSGVIVKAGLLGMLRMVPPGTPGTELFGPVLLGFGLFSAFAAVVLGLAQRQVKVVLAYSTVSQMGLVLAMYAALLMAPGSAPALLPWLGLLVLHHGLNKAALFLACGCAPGRSRLRMALVALPALAIAGAPLSTGMYAKTGLKQTLAAAGYGSGWALLLGLSSLATALLLWHVWSLLRQDRHYRPAHSAWIGMTLAGLVVPWLWGLFHGLDPDLGHSVWPSLWPLLAVATLLWATRRAARVRLPEIPAGDLVVPLERAAAAIARRWRDLRQTDAHDPLNLYPLHVRVTLLGLWLERKMSALPIAGSLILALGGLLWLIHHLPGGE